MVIYLDSFSFQTFPVCICTRLTVVMGHHHAADKETDLFELALETKHIFVIGDSEVSTYLVLFDVYRTDYNDDFCLILKLLEHIKLAVRLEARQHTACVVVVE